MNLVIENTLYSLLIYFLITRNISDSRIIFLDNIKLKKINNLYIVGKLSYKKNPFIYYLRVLKMNLYVFYHIIRYKDIRLYGNDDLNYLGFFKCKNFFVLEDGGVNYSYKKSSKNIKFILRDFMKLRNPFYAPFGYSEKVKKIYLTGLAPIPEEIKDKVEIINLKELWNKKSDVEKEEILNIFGFDKNIVNNIKNRKYILYTQPLSEDEILLESEKIELYSKILEKYDKNYVVLKKHPREKTDYKKIFPDIEVMDQVFPAELLTLLDIHFEKAITIFSTAALTDDKVQVDFYGTEIHPKLFKRFGSQDKIMKRNVFLNEEEKK